MKRFRSNKLIKPRMQLRLVAVFLLIAVAAVVAQAVVLNTTVIRAAHRLPGAGEELLALWPGLLGQNVLFLFLLLVPGILALGVLATFRIAGPVFRIEQHLARVVQGEDPGPCHLRQGDDLQELCQLLNRAVARLKGETVPIVGEGLSSLPAPPAALPARDPLPNERREDG